MWADSKPEGRESSRALNQYESGDGYRARALLYSLLCFLDALEVRDLRFARLSASCFLGLQYLTLAAFIRSEPTKSGARH